MWSSDDEVRKIVTLGKASALGAAMAAAFVGADAGSEPGYSVDWRGKRVRRASPATKAKRKAQRRARKITRQRS
jgi:hypothetical protein